MSNTKPQFDLEWEAFLYASGEMSPEQTDAFESRMLQDPAVADAVSEAVAVTCALVTTCGSAVENAS